MSKTIRLSLELTNEVNTFLEKEAEQAGTTKSDVLRKAIALMKAAAAGRQKGRELALIDPANERVISRIVGI